MNIIARILLVLVLLSLFSCSSSEEESPPLVQQSFVTALSVDSEQQDAVGINGFKRYAAAVDPGSVYKISMTGLSDDADLLFYGSDDSHTTKSACAVDNTSVPGTHAEDCLVTASGSQLSFAVSGSHASLAGCSFSLKVERVNVNALSVSMPLLDGTITTNAALYAVPVTTGAAYTVGITGQDNDADLYVFRDSALTLPANCSLDNRLFAGSAAEDCTLTADTSTLYIVVDGLYSSRTDVRFTVFASPAPSFASPVNQGSAAFPQSLSVNALTFGQVAADGVSWYTVNGLVAGSDYTISISGVTSNTDLTFYRDSTFTQTAECVIDNTASTSTRPESCILTAGDSAVYFTASARPSAASYLLLVEPGP